ncbi:unnamed protein product [Chilo suppressalis]|uniref:RRM domain-containing protein n=1 Tax=Chilo suppressalis TaxID=168631 RepID=A0ABN8AYM2_CHISP|nr:unnamed protein product [Chilo suppressalis]
MEPATEGSDATATANAAATAKANATTTATVNATTTATVNAAKTATATSSGGKRRDQSDTVMVIVTGYPQYSQPQDLVRIFSKFGEVKVDKLTPKFAILSYTNKDAALEAVQASKKVNVYGEFLIVKLHNEKMAAELAKSSPKKDFPRTKQKGTIIEPAQIDLSGSFPQQLERLLAAVRLTQEEVTALTALYTDVENALRPHYAGCSAVPFGSITTGLGVKSSDADCFVLLPPHHRTPHANHVNKARRLLELHPKPINVPTAGTQALPLDGIRRRSHDSPRGPSADWYSPRSYLYRERTLP